MPFTAPKNWFADCDFTTDWSSRAFEDWVEHLGGLREEPLEILEIGAWEGRGSLFFLNFFPKSRLTALDIFTLGNEERFDRNVLARFPNRTTKVKGSSTTELDRFAVEGSTFDLIYLDGSHLRDDVLLDSILAWRLLKVGGYLIWDDYQLVKAMPQEFTKADQDPKPAIDLFIEWHGREIDILHREYQVIAKKTAPHYREEIRVELSRASDANLSEARRKAREFEQRLAEAEGTLLAHREKLARTEARLDESQAALAFEREKWAQSEHDLRQEINQNVVLLRAGHAEVAALKELLTRERAEVAALDERLTRERAEIAALNERLTREGAEVATLNERLAREGAEIAALKERLAREGAEVTALRERLTREGAEVAALKESVRRERSEAADLRERLSSSEASAMRRIAEYREELRSAQQRQSATETSLTSAQAALTQRYHELSILADLLHEQECENADVAEQLNWLKNLHELALSEPGWWRMLPAAVRRRRQQDRLKRSGIFDSADYLNRYPDVAEAGFEPLLHYVRHGLSEGRLR